jgi:RNA polymerase sigma factor (sigma-70 family)
MNEIEALWRQALNIRNYIVSANLRLVVSISKKFVRLDSDFFNLVAEGNVKLIRAVELFDFRRNVKFSTYAYAAIQNKFRHLCAVRALEASRVWPENNFAEVLDHRADNYVSEANRKHNAEQIKELFRQIPEREQEVLRLRYGLDTYEEQTLAQVGQTLGVTKERVRQLEARAFIRFKRFAVA